MLESAQKVVNAARQQVESNVQYVAVGYVGMSYPGGDVDPAQGVCTDLVVRAFRAIELDLQQEIHEDRKSHKDAYPKQPAVDRNIDHRRCKNQEVWFAGHAESITTDLHDSVAWQPGDVVFFIKDGRNHPWHVGIVSERRAPEVRAATARVLKNVSLKLAMYAKRAAEMVRGSRG